MHWLTRPEAEVLAPLLATHYVPQMILLAAKAQDLPARIPTRPELIPTDKGPPSPMYQWYCRIGDRLITVESEAKDTPHESVVIHSIFLRNQDKSGDWVVLPDLAELSELVCVRRPLFIESRTVSPQWIVYRPDPQGWKTAIYKAASKTDAESLLEFMQQDEWNRACFVGKPALAGEWATIQGECVILGWGSGLDEALRHACYWSLRHDNSVLVKDISGLSKEVFVVCRGRVVDSP